LAKLQELACGSDSLQFYAIFKRQVPACAIDGATKRYGFNIFGLLAQRQKGAACGRMDVRFWKLFSCLDF